MVSNILKKAQGRKFEKEWIKFIEFIVVLLIANCLIIWYFRTGNIDKTWYTCCKILFFFWLHTVRCTTKAKSIKFWSIDETKWLVWICHVSSLSVTSFVICWHAQIQRGWGGGGGGWVRGPDPLKNHKNIGFLSNTGPDPLKNHKATKPAFNVGPSSASQLNAPF